MKTMFLRVLESEDKARALLEATRGSSLEGRRRRFEVDLNSFAAVPGAPFAYWATPALLQAFRDFGALSRSRVTTKCGAGTLDNPRFLRLKWEIPSHRSAWTHFPKGGAHSRWHSDVALMVNWPNEGAELKTFVAARVGSASRKIQSQEYYLRPGLTWPRRTTSGLAFRVMPSGCIFSDQGPGLFADDDDTDALLCFLAILNSRIFAACVATQLAAADAAARTYEVGIILRTPMPSVGVSERQAFADLARRSWSLTRTADTRAENSGAFVLPALLQIPGTDLAARANAWFEHLRAITDELADRQAEIDRRCFALFGIDDSKWSEIGDEIVAPIPEHTVRSAEQGSDADEEEEGDEVAAASDASGLAAELVSWAAGVAVGRFDVQLATGTRALPTEPEPFDALQTCSPGMLSDEHGLPVADPPAGYPLAFPEAGLLVEDKGHRQDLAAAIRRVFGVVFGAEAEARWSEASELLDATAHDLRRWLAKGFFEYHIKRYSRSRRRAPIYWQLGTHSGAYAIWLYAQRIDQDTLFRVQNDFVAPRLAHEERRLDGLRADVQTVPTSALRKELAASELLAEDLRTMLAEVKRIAPLWKPDLNDGVVITMAPLWRLVPQHPGWQQELKTTWDALCKGDYDWAHVAMHLWPERVVPKCADDRSLAIAHGLEEHLWIENFSGRWRKRDTPEKDYEHVLDHFKRAAKTQLLSDIEGFWRTTFAERRQAAKQWWVEFEAGSHDDHPLALRLWPSRILHAAWDDESLARTQGLRMPRAADGDAAARDRWVTAQLKKHPPALDALDLGLVASFLGDLEGEAGWAERWSRLWNGEFDRTHRIALMVRPAEVVPLALADIDVARAQGLDRWFWLDDGEDGPRHVEAPDAEVARAIRARHSDAVKAALDDLLSAPISGAARGRGRGRRSKGGS